MRFICYSFRGCFNLSRLRNGFGTERRMSISTSGSITSYCRILPIIRFGWAAGKFTIICTFSLEFLNMSCAEFWLIMGFGELCRTFWFCFELMRIWRSSWNPLNVIFCCWFIMVLLPFKISLKLFGLKDVCCVCVLAMEWFLLKFLANFDPYWWRTTALNPFELAMYCTKRPAPFGSIRK